MMLEQQVAVVEREVVVGMEAEAVVFYSSTSATRWTLKERLVLMAISMLAHTPAEVAVEVFLSELSHLKEVGLYRLVQSAAQT